MSSGPAYWTEPASELARRLGTPEGGLTSAEAARRLEEHGPNRLRADKSHPGWRVLARQLASPLLLLLLFAAIASAVTGAWIDALIVLGIVAVSVGIGTWREYRAETAVARLRARVRTRTRVWRDGTLVDLPTEEVVPGDLVQLGAGSLVPADGVVVEATDFFVNEAVLTGESFAVEKHPGVAARDAPLAARLGCVFLGTNVRSGSARCLMVATGTATQFGAIAHRLELAAPETDFQRGLRHFGYLLGRTMFVIVVLVYAANTIAGRPPVETFLFAIALAVGLAPELLPTILSVNLARGAQQLAAQGVLVRRLSAIENLGSMDVLCTDKTGTLTEGVVRLDGAFDADGAPSPRVAQLAAWNAALQSGLANPLDAAILDAGPAALEGVEKLAEIPYDFVRKRLGVVVRTGAGIQLVVKGAFDRVLEACTSAADGSPLDDARRAELTGRYEAWCRGGIRVLALAVRTLPAQEAYGRADERELGFAGFLTFLDRPKEGVAGSIAALAERGVAVKVISGDSRLVVQHLAAQVGLRAERILTGAELDELHDEALWHSAERTDLFAEVDPRQKERIIVALQKTGHVVGFLGDGVNDAPAMHAADTGLSVEGAVDVARAAADFVLLERDLGVIGRGIAEGRRTFANTLKYVLTTTSANLGNMISMAVASLFLPFLPLLAGQVLLNNLLSDVPAFGLAADSVDPEQVARPGRWDMGLVGHFMVWFGSLSAVFDFLTFALLLGPFAAGPAAFRSGWFVESLLTELVVALVVRTRRRFYRSRPGRLLLGSTVVLVVVALAIPELPLAGALGFQPLPASLLAALVGVTALYALATELLKLRFFRWSDARARR